MCQTPVSSCCCPWTSVSKLPFQDLTIWSPLLAQVRIEGLQALKPTTGSSPEAYGSGLDLHLKLVVNPPNPGTVATSPDFIVEDVRIGVREPVQAQATKQEIRHLIELCKAEAAAGQRVLKGMLKLLEGVGLSPPAAEAALGVPAGSDAVNGLSAERLVSSLLGETSSNGIDDALFLESELQGVIEDMDRLSSSKEEDVQVQMVKRRLERLRAHIGALQRQAAKT